MVIINLFSHCLTDHLLISGSWSLIDVNTMQKLDARPINPAGLINELLSRDVLHSERETSKHSDHLSFFSSSTLHDKCTSSALCSVAPCSLFIITTAKTLVRTLADVFSFSFLIIMDFFLWRDPVCRKKLTCRKLHGN